MTASYLILCLMVTVRGSWEEMTRNQTIGEGPTLFTDGATVQDAGCLLQRVPGVCFAVAVYRKLLGIGEESASRDHSGGGGGS
ncbi:unnamed protein product [Tetraodon nigroviridis]|uniref:(spotted green pufferfish) hypothetical protein n=1 Tax=Tetraodon nigroviridis TaxID=99883 RepID=Q4RHT2_TETNG|nr:unnamed protein product [Tetraodon nigroviridis]